MPVVRSGAATVHEIHGARFTSYASAASGSTELCAWQVEIPAGVRGQAHTISREEIVLLLRGALLVSLDGEETVLTPGDTVIAPAGTALRVDNPGEESAQAWATTTIGLTATLADGSVLCPPWAS